MTNFRRLALLGLVSMASAAAAAAAAAATASSPNSNALPIFGKQRPISTSSRPPTESSMVELSEVRANSQLGAYLMRHARRLEDGDEDGDEDEDANDDAEAQGDDAAADGDDQAYDGDDGGNDANANYYGFDYSFLGDYSLKFQGCHHIHQWNEDADEEDEVRIQTKRLVRFRLCPTASCSDSKSSGCNSKYGDYIVDMDTFVYAYLTARQADREAACYQYQEACEDMCNGAADDDCSYACYANFNVAYCAGQDDGFDPMDYAQCAQYQFDGNYAAANDDWAADDDANGRYRRLGDAYGYYVGPYCGDQGGAVRFGLFTDNTCTTFASGNSDTFKSMAGFELPYSGDDGGIVSYECSSCAADNSDGNYDDDAVVNYGVQSLCRNMYSVAGKCENKMNVDYPNDAACTYIEGVKIIRDDGVIRTHSVRKSKVAAVTIGLFTTLAVLLGAYVFYLRNKLGRAKINLSSQG